MTEKDVIKAALLALNECTEEMMNADEKGGKESKAPDPASMDSFMVRWSKEALQIVTQYLSEQQKISLLSE